MKGKLIDIVSVRFGVHAKRMKAGPMALVQSSAIRGEGVIEQAYIDRTDPSLVSYKDVDLLRPNDVLLIGKGSANTAALWPGSDEDTIASGVLYVIRPKSPALLPAFLVAYLNSHPAQVQMAAMRKVGTVPVLGRAALEKLEVPVPSLGVQRKLVQLAEVTRRVRQHLNELNIAYTQLLNGAWAQLDEQ